MTGPVDLDPRLLPLVPGYLQARREDGEALRAAIASAEWARVADIGHRLAGSGTSYGFAAISEIGARLEAAGRAGDADAAGRAWRALEGTVEAALRAL